MNDMKTITAFDLLDEAMEYTNRSVVEALISLADRLVGFGTVDSHVPAGYGNLRLLVANHIDGGIDEVLQMERKFTPISEYVNNFNLHALDIENKITEESFMHELELAGMIVLDESGKFGGICNESIDKGYMRYGNDDVLEISTKGLEHLLLDMKG